MRATTFNAMAPLAVGDFWNLDSEESLAEQAYFAHVVSEAQKAGATGVSIDVWFGVVCKDENWLQNPHRWDYYDRMTDFIIAAKLNVILICSLHKCGGNIGDTVNVNVPMWLFQKAANKLGTGNIRDVQCISESGKASDDFISPWASYLVLDDFKAFFADLHSHFAPKAKHITEINISLGAAGEMRYSSYRKDDDSDYPNRGKFQFFSSMAKLSFIEAAVKHYGSIKQIREAWGPVVNIEPPVDVEGFLTEGKHINTESGRFLFDWAQLCLFEHADMIVRAALDEFSHPGAAFEGIDLGVKVPGIHWRMGHWEGDHIVFSDRLAELPAGLLRTRSWNSDLPGHGYQEIIAFVRGLQNIYPNQRVVLHFTCLEMPDGENESLALQLTRWVAQEAARQGVPIKGENALNYTLFVVQAWMLLRAAIGLNGFDRLYDGLTLLRVTDLVENEVARDGFTAMVADTLKQEAG